MTNVSDIYNYIDSFAPFDTAMSFDNCGLLVGDENTPVSKVFVCLDITKETIEEAKAFGASLIISHHPVIFSPLKSIDRKSVVYSLIENRLTAICAHTNLDMAKFGVNRSLAEKMGIRSIEGMDILPDTKAPQWFWGELPEALFPEDFALMLKENLKAGAVKYTKYNKMIKKVGFCSGSGADYIENAKKAGLDAFVTAEVKHHQLLMAKELGICVFDAGHFSTEAHIKEFLVDMLRKKFPGVMFKASSETDPALYV